MKINMQMIMQIIKSKNPTAMINNLAKDNPSIAQALPVVKEIMNSGGSKRDQLRMACNKANINFDDASKQVENLGINID